jgi:hypothetical protein
MPDGDVICKIVLEPGFSPHGSQKNTVKSKYCKTGTETSTSFLKRIGAECLGGYQLKYIYFLNPQAKNRLTVPILDYSEIANQGATMYRGKRPDSVITNTSSFHDETGGVNPTSGLHTRPVESDHSQ